MKKILADFNIDEKQAPAKLVLYLIGKFKDKAWTPSKLPNSENDSFGGYKIGDIYTEYQKRLVSLNAADFGDLILYVIQIFNSHPDVLEQYHRKFRYLLVDEYQDTNVAQYLWLRQLAQATNNICCVGDDDQSIYGWRGAEVTNILRFDKDFKDAQIIRLEKNYRSTGTILKAATAVIANNQDRHDKTLWTESEDGSKIRLNSYYDDKEESRAIAEEIDNLRVSENIDYRDITILIRAGYQSRNFEESFNYFRIPYRIIGGQKFYERMEIRDVIAYIRLLVNRNDSLAFERVINVPRRGVGPAVMQKLSDFANANTTSLYEAAVRLMKTNEIKGKVAESISAFFTTLDQASSLLITTSPSQVVETLLELSGYMNHWRSEKTDEAKDRVDNIKELINSLSEYNTLNEYLEHIALVTDTDNEFDDNRVSLMTMHAAKGLEYDTVFLPGWEEGLFPSQKSMDENGRSGLEEERRLAYVAITRAKRNLYISYTCNRRVYGSYQMNTPSRFIDEIPAATYQIVSNFGSYYNKKYPVKQEPLVETTTATGNELNLKPGKEIKHSKFGKGIVLKLHADCAEIMFPGTGVKKIMYDFLKKQMQK